MTTYKVVNEELLLDGFQRQCPHLSLEMELYESLETILSYGKTGEPWPGVYVSERQGRAERDILPIQRLLHEMFLVLAKSVFPASPSPCAGPSPRGFCIQSGCSVLPYAPPYRIKLLPYEVKEF